MINIKSALKLLYRPKSYSKLAVYFIVIYCLIYILLAQSWKEEKRVIQIDVIGYYGYLPATFIYKDLSFEFTENYNGPHKFYFYTDETPEGKKFVRYSMGLAILFLPFFFLGHLFAHLFGFDTGGYSEPYKFFLLMSCLFYLWIGLVFLRKLLLNYFSDKAVTITLIALLMSTNLFHYIREETTMTHAYSFSLIAVFLYYTNKWYQNPKIKYTLLIGLTSGLFCLVRPFNILVTLFFVFYGIKSFRDFIPRFNLLFRKIHLIGLIILVFIIVWIPQLIYWKYVSGSFLFYTYDISGGKFYFNNPHIIEGLFSYRKGWLIYNPVMWFSVLGLFFISKYHKGYLINFFIFYPVFIYCLYSWWSWWNGGSFGGRTMIDIYAILSLPLAAAVNYFLENKNKVLRISVASVFLASFLLGVIYNRQYRDGIIHYDGMTKEAFWASFLKFRVTPDYWDLICRPDYDLARQGIYICTYELGKYREMEEKPRKVFAN